MSTNREGRTVWVGEIESTPLYCRRCLREHGRHFRVKLGVRYPARRGKQIRVSLRDRRPSFNAATGMGGPTDTRGIVEHEPTVSIGTAACCGSVLRVGGRIC